MSVFREARISLGDAVRAALAHILPPHIIPPGFDRQSELEIGSFDGFELAYRRNTADERVIAESFSHDGFFVGTPEYNPSESDTIIDIGAHIGTFAILAATKVSSGRVYAIEASRDTCNFLRVNLALNRCTNVSAHHLAIGDHDGSATLYHQSGNWGHSTVSGVSKRGEAVQASSLVSFMDEHGIQQCNFMKLNCEGAEFPILLGTPHCYLQRFATMLVLYHCDLWRQNTEADISDHLSAAGFSVTVRNQSGPRGWLIATRGRA